MPSSRIKSLSLHIVIKNYFKQLIFRMKYFHIPSVLYCANNSLLPEVLMNTSSHELRKLLFLPKSQYFTQLNQDIFALLCNRFTSGYFLEIGANDGFTLSNTHYLEQFFGWKGLLVEANPKYQDSLKRRSATSAITAITHKEGDYLFVDAGLFGGLLNTLGTIHQDKTKDKFCISVRGDTLKAVLDKHASPPIINFVSIDVEGAEVSIVEQLCNLSDYRFVCGCIEYNGRMDDYIQLINHLNQANYRIVWNSQRSHDLFFVDKKYLL